MEFNKILKAIKTKAIKLQKENNLAGYIFKEGVYGGIKRKGEEYYVLYYKCPYCGYIGKKRIVLKKPRGNQPIFVLVCDNCGKEIDRIEKIPMR